MFAESNQNFRRLAGAGVAVLLGTFAPAAANAALTLTLSEPGFTPVTFTDTTNAGNVTYFNTFGDFSTNLVVGFSNKLSGVGAAGSLQVQSLDVKSLAGTVGAKTLTVTLSDNGFMFPGTPTSVLSLTGALGGTLTGQSVGDSVTYASSATPVGGPTVSAPVSTYTATVANPASTSFSMSTPVSTFFVEGTSYALSSVTTLSLSGPGATANLSGSTTTAVAVPEPATAGLAAAAVGALAVRRRRRA